MLTRDDVRIATPCGVDFSRMTRREATRRFCEACRTVVHDLSSMTEAEARTLLDARASEGLCVRYLADDAGRLHFLPDVPASLLSRAKRAALAAAMMAGPLSLTACMGARIAEPPQAMAQPERASGRVVATKGGTRLELSNLPGTIVDATPVGADRTTPDATTPEAGAPEAETPSATPHPFVSGRCEGDALGCREARGLLQISESFPDFVARLRAVGFTVQPG